MLQCKEVKTDNQFSNSLPVLYLNKGRNSIVQYLALKIRGTPASVALLLMLERALEELLVAHLVKKIVTTLFTQHPAPVSYPEPVESSTRFYNPFLCKSLCDSPTIS